MAAITTRQRTAESPALPRWAPLVLVLAIGLLWIVTFENGQLLDLIGAKAAASGNFFHELFHDGRHLLGVPCH
jgi:hypothetical protein